ncbi:MAG: hypothetical protein JXJ04_01310 [Spirochaetales bacterium]|nr:hypothetical protein [Spirochaetales bacterium]
MTNTKIILITIVSVIIFVVFSITCYYGYALYTRTYGINLKPYVRHVPVSVPVFLQNDERWKADTMGSPGYTLGESGCLVASICSVLYTMDIKTDPKELNSLFTGNKVYNSHGEIIWFKIGDVFPGVSHSHKNVFNHTTIEADLKNKSLPIVKVRYRKNGIFHWVVIIGADEKDFIIIDPLHKEKKPMALSVHGKVYAYRTLKKE